MTQRQAQYAVRRQSFVHSLATKSTINVDPKAASIVPPMPKQKFANAPPRAKGREHMSRPSQQGQCANNQSRSSSQTSSSVSSTLWRSGTSAHLRRLREQISRRAKTVGQERPKRLARHEDPPTCSRPDKGNKKIRI